MRRRGSISRPARSPVLIHIPLFCGCLKNRVFRELSRNISVLETKIPHVAANITKKTFRKTFKKVKYTFGCISPKWETFWEFLKLVRNLRIQAITCITDISNQYFSQQPVVGSAINSYSCSPEEAACRDRVLCVSFAFSERNL